MKTLEQVKTEHFVKAFIKYKGNKEKISNVLGISRRSVFNWVKKLSKIGLIEIKE